MLKIRMKQNTNCLLKNANEAKYQLLIKKRKGAGLKHLNDSKPFVEYPNKKRKILIVLDNVIADMLSNKKNLIQQ